MITLFAPSCLVIFQNVENVERDFLLCLNDSFSLSIHRLRLGIRGIERGFLLRLDDSFSDSFSLGTHRLYYLRATDVHGVANSRTRLVCHCLYGRPSRGGMRR